MVRLVEEMQNGTIDATPVLVLSDKSDAGGIQKAKNLNIPTEVVVRKNFEDNDAFHAALDAALKSKQVDMVCLAGFMRILSPEFVEKWAGKILNIHPSLLPKYKGLHTHQRAIDAGDTEAGCTVHLVTAELDGGPILSQARVPILKDDTADDLAARVLREEHRIYPETLAKFVDGDFSR